MPKPIRPIRIEGNVAYVPLTRGYESVIDAVDVPMVKGRNWFVMICNQKPYAAQNSERDESGNRKTVLMHRVLTKAPPGMDVDHKDGDGLNNRRSINLRIATRSENRRNTGAQANNTSGFKGVSWNKSVGRYMAYIKLHGRMHHLGYRDTAEDAHALYVEARYRMHGEFGRIA